MPAPPADWPAVPTFEADLALDEEQAVDLLPFSRTGSASRGEQVGLSRPAALDWLRVRCRTNAPRRSGLPECERVADLQLAAQHAELVALRVGHGHPAPILGPPVGHHARAEA